MSSQENNPSISETSKTILAGRIYPAIQSCVSIRYKILVGYFAIVAYLLSDKELLEVFVKSKATIYLAVVFSLFAFHNFANYWKNANEQSQLE